jgi:hypothetical protein
VTIRRFKIHLSSATFNLTDELDHTYFFDSPSGLGLTTDYAYEKLGNAYVRVGDAIPQRSVSGVLIVRGENRQSVYENYQVFVNALSKDNNACKLEYSLPNGSVYMMDADIVQIEKSEIEHNDRALKCTMSIIAKSKWYDEEYRYIDGRNDIAGGKIYGFDYGYSYTESLIGTFNIQNHSSNNVPTILTIFGPCLNPRWTIICNEQEVLHGQCNIKLATDDELIINSIDGQTEITHVIGQTSEKKNAYQYCNFDMQNFVKLPLGECKILVTNESGDMVKSAVVIRREFNAV